MRIVDFLSVLISLTGISIANVIPPTDASLHGIHSLGYLNHPVVKRDDFEDDEYRLKKVGNNSKHFETRRSAWIEISNLFEELDLACNWVWFSTEVFEKKRVEWSAKLKDLEVKYKGKLPEPYNVDNKLVTVTSKYNRYFRNYEWQLKLGLDQRIGFQECCELMNLFARFVSLITLNGDLKTSISNISTKIKSLLKVLKAIDERGSRIKSMMTPLIRQKFVAIEEDVIRIGTQIKAHLRWPQEYDFQQYNLSPSCS